MLLCREILYPEWAAIPQDVRIELQRRYGCMYHVSDPQATANAELGAAVHREVEAWRRGEQTELGVGHVATTLIDAETMPILSLNKEPQPVAEQVHAMFGLWSLEDAAALGRVARQDYWNTETWRSAANLASARNIMPGLADHCRDIAEELERQEGEQK